MLTSDAVRAAVQAALAILLFAGLAKVWELGDHSSTPASRTILALAYQEACRPPRRSRCGVAARHRLHARPGREGLHALDGARYRRDAPHADAMLYKAGRPSLLRIIEADERGLADVLGLEFEPSPYALSSLLTCCDMTTSPDGEFVHVDRRLAEIHHRYGPGHLVRAVEQVHDRAARTA